MIDDHIDNIIEEVNEEFPDEYGFKKYPLRFGEGDVGKRLIIKYKDSLIMNVDIAEEEHDKHNYISEPDEDHKPLHDVIRSYFKKNNLFYVRLYQKQS